MDNTPGGTDAQMGVVAVDNKTAKPAAASDSTREGSSVLLSAEIPGLTVAAVAGRLGVAPATLRTWDRRYGLGPSDHAAGEHRRYSADDLARLVIMRRLALDGVAPQDAAKAARQADVSAVTPEDLEADLRGLQSDTSRTGEADSGQSDDGGDKSAAAPSGASILHLPSSSHRGAVTAAAVIDAVLAGRQDECLELLALGTGDDPVVWWRTIVAPALKQLAMRTVLARPGETPDLLLVAAVLKSISGYVSALDEDAARRGVPLSHPSRNRQMVLVFVAPGDPLAISAHVFAAALLQHEVAVRIVTGPSNEHRVLEIVAMVRPKATVMISDLSHPELGLVSALHEANPDLPIFVGLRDNSAAASLPLAATVQRIRSFEGLVHEVLAVVQTAGT